MSPPPSSSPLPAADLRRHARRGAVTVVIMIFLSRVLGLVREMVIAHQFGAGRETDVYNAAFVIPEFFYYLVAGGVIITVFVPLFAEYRTRGEPGAEWELFNVVTTVLGVGTALGVGLGMLLTPWFIPRLFPEFDPDQIRQTIRLTLIIFPAQFFFVLGGIFYGTLNAHQRFLLPACGPLLYNVAIITGALLAGQRGVEGMAWGVVGGAFLGQMVLQGPALKKLGAPFRWRFRPSHPGVRRMVVLLVPVVFGLSSQQFYLQINRVLAQGMQDGAITWLQYANRLMQLPIGIFASGIAVGIFPTLAQFASENRLVELRGTLAAAARSVLYLTAPMAMLFVVLGEPVVRLLFQHGHYFVAEDTLQTAQALIFYAVGIPAASCQQVLTRGFYATQDTRTPVVAGVLAFAVNVTLNLLLRGPMGHRGLALGSSIANWVNLILLAYLLRPRLGGLEGGQLVRSARGMVGGLAGLMITAWAVDQAVTSVWSPTSLLPRTLEVGLAASTGLMVYLMVSWRLGTPEAASSLHYLRQRFGGGKQGSQQEDAGPTLPSPE